MIKEYFKIAIRNLRTRQLRSWLTILGIVIGIFLVVSLLSLSTGVEEAIMKQLRMMGSELIMVFPGDVSDIMKTFIGEMDLTDNDLNAIKRSQGVDVVIPYLWGGEIVRHRDESKTILLTGTPFNEAIPLYREDMGWDLTDGRWPIPGRREVIVGSFVHRDIFPEMEIGDRINIKGKPFEVTGFLRSLGNRDDDSMIHLDSDDFKIVTGKREGAQVAIVRASLEYPVDDVAENIKLNLEETRKKRKGEETSFSVITSEKASDMVGNIMSLIQVAVFSFASIALLVGGIGIMNTMYTAVYERTREIGIMKAIGAKNKVITMIFLIESGIVGLLGGVGGLVLGFMLAKIIEISFRSQSVFDFEVSITPGLILLGLGFSFVIGCVAGALPAYRASKLEPVDALRYE
ncbi:MAG: ABC transporter permease [Candidatus Pacebacteria bacterium]|jgi:putative ABC transport system permease protein|nr:ABC transporter permease [Candidatus Paceibacterota bacterium]MDD3728976.1 ABC transporter permease [Candidatus Paceibacterota bacterium]MDD4201648.1 ABC transporter permease [Candidatus Paceibacterota bacterium]MDD5445845.1 ABC transporter permease [Candidatus Paceibacterota bacterium]